MTPAALGAANYTLTCTGAGGSIAASSTVNAISSVGFLLTANENGNVSVYKLDVATGVPTEVGGSPFPAGGVTRWVVLSPDNRFAYALNGSTQDVSGYSIDEVTGALTALPGSPFAPGGSKGMAIHPSGKWIYVAAFDSLLTYAVNPTTGALTNVGTLAVESLSIAIHPSGNFAYATGRPNLSPVIFVYAIDSNGALTPIQGSPFAGGAFDGTVAIDPAGKYAYLPSGNETSPSPGKLFAYSIDASTGALTPVAGSPYTTSVGPHSIAFDPQSAFLYLGCFGGPSSNGGLHGYAINSSTGALTQVPGSPFHTEHSWAIGMNGSGKVLYEIRAADLRSFAVGATGSLTEIPATRRPRAGFGLSMALTH